MEISWLMTTRIKQQQPTKVLLQAGLDVETIGCSSLSAAVPADEYLFGFLLLTYNSVFQSASVPGLDQQ